MSRRKEDEAGRRIKGRGAESRTVSAPVVSIIFSFSQSRFLLFGFYCTFTNQFQESGGGGAVAGTGTQLVLFNPPHSIRRVRVPS